MVPILTPDEKKVFGQLYAAADSENMGVVTGELAVKFFEKSGLNPRILGEVRRSGLQGATPAYASELRNSRR